MQKTGWTIHSSFLVLLSGLDKGFTLDAITRGQWTTIFLCLGPFSAWWWTSNVQSCSWPVWRQSFAILVEKVYLCSTVLRLCTPKSCGLEMGPAVRDWSVKCRQRSYILFSISYGLFCCFVARFICPWINQFGEQWQITSVKHWQKI